MASNDSATGQKQADEIDFAIDTPVRGSGGGGSGLPSAAELKQQARGAADQARQAASSAMSQATVSAQQVKEQVGQQASEAARKLRERGTSFLSDQKTRASGTLEEFSSAIDAAACRLEKDNDDAIAGYVHGAADQLRVVSNYLKDKPVESLFSDFCDIARRKPEYFVGGMFVAGLALARFAKSAAVQAPARQPSYGGGNYGGSGYGESNSGGNEPSYRGSGTGGTTASDPYSTSPRSALPGRGGTSTGGHEIVNPYAVPVTGLDTPSATAAGGSATPNAAVAQKPLGL